MHSLTLRAGAAEPESPPLLPVRWVRQADFNREGIEAVLSGAPEVIGTVDAVV